VQRQVAMSRKQHESKDKNSDLTHLGDNLSDKKDGQDVLSSLRPVRLHFRSAFLLSRLANLIFSLNHGTNGLSLMTFLRMGACFSSTSARDLF